MPFLSFLNSMKCNLFFVKVETGMDAHDLAENAAAECHEFTKDLCCVRVAILMQFYHRWVYHDAHRVVECFYDCSYTILRVVMVQNVSTKLVG